MPAVATITVNPAIDKSTRVERVAPDRKLRCGEPRRDPGGGGVNVARVLKRLGEEAPAVYPAGGPTGEILGELLAREDVPQRPVPSGEWTRENLTVLETSTGQQYRFGMPGPELAGEEWRGCLDALWELSPPPEYVVASGSLPPGVPEDFYGRLASQARKREIRLVVDSSGEPLRRAADAGVYLLKPNLSELADLSGRMPHGEGEQERMTRSLVEEGKAEVVVLSLGAAGAMLVTREGVERMRSPTVRIDSRVGAGDSMVAGIVFGLARDWDLRSAVRHGVAAGAAAVTTPATELSRHEDVTELFEQLADG